MLPTPTKFMLVAAASEGMTPLNAFDGALLKAGIGNLNLLKVSSIVPPRARLVKSLEIPPGSLVPTAYGAKTSGVPGETLAAAVAVARVNEETYGMIIEVTNDEMNKKEIETLAKAMAVEGLRMRGLTPTSVIAKGVSHRVKKTGCVLAAVVLWS